MVAWTRRLLVVEDDVLLASLLAESLGASGFDVAVASDAREARDRVDDFDPDVVLLDVALGSGPSGVHLAHALQPLRLHAGEAAGGQPLVASAIAVASASINIFAPPVA